MWGAFYTVKQNSDVTLLRGMASVILLLCLCSETILFTYNLYFEKMDIQLHCIN